MVEVPSQPVRPLNLAVATLGLIGGSIALLAHEQGANVTVWHHNETPRVWAQQHGITFAESIEQLCATEPDILLVASPLKAMNSVMESIAEFVRPRTTVTDAGSVKERVLDAVVRAGLAGQYVGAHPMAGNEKSGFAAAHADLLVGATWAVTLTTETDAHRVGRVLEFVTCHMRGRALVTDPKSHDESVALISHLPHVLAHTLTAVTAQASSLETTVKLAAGSFRDVTRVARENPERNLAMVTENRHAVAQAVARSIEFLERVHKGLIGGEVHDQDLLNAFRDGDLATALYRASHVDSTDPALTFDEEIELGELKSRLLQLGSHGSLVEHAVLGPDFKAPSYAMVRMSGLPQ